MTRATRLTSLLLICTFWTIPAQSQPIRMLYEEGADSIGAYCMTMLELALSKIEHDYDIRPETGDHSPARIIEMVREGRLDLLWASATREVEEQLLPVRIPLYKGLLGHRIFIIHPDNQYRFASARSLEGLEDLTFGQGTTWADTEILEHNGLDVVRVNKYESLFLMVDGQRFDAFPRGVQEPWGEIASRPELELTVEERVMLVYRMPFYLFVSPESPQLAEDIERGFEIALADGSFDEAFFNDPTVQNVLEQANLEERVTIELDNPGLPVNTPLERAELWINPSEW